MKEQVMELMNSREATLEMVKRLAQQGLSITTMAYVLGISPDKFKTLLRNDSELYDAVEEGYEEPNRRVEESLYQLATGVKIRQVKAVGGKPVEVVIKETPPNVAAAIFWLKNREPSRWRDSIDVNVSLRDQMHQAHTAIKSGKVQSS